MKIIFMGTPEIAVPVLETLSESYDVELVVTMQDRKKGRGKKLLPPPVKEKAIELGLEVYQPENINSEESVKFLKSKDADLFVVIAYGQILKEEVLKIPKLYPINIHASILPKLRGAAPINRAIIQGDKISGVSIMKMERGLDTGDVALCEEIEIPNLNAEELEIEISKLGSKLIVKFIEELESGEITFQKQDSTLATYAEKIDKFTGYIDFNTMKSGEIINLVRGLYKKPAASTVYKTERFKILRATQIEDNTSAVPGEIIESNKNLIVKTLDGAIEILEVQFPGKRIMNIEEYLAGNSFEVGSILGG
ncbi:methionyl-tRNA formyltransferase [Anaerosphaera aminiphila DSM 21120]|uniref:Methionyl-tRNA formyltransferase n=1 Tax=Anaerosphaera aminiphila DSM 21120 TaxID=1120995 RepID=A0A1M5T0H0_9FIRM|nr:methionyl-tRNA formyltransferase [Anaerosphaera aminiphila]SHH44100.1 methionyl-tRNA formyltransferase [Anaerosphaera aminiphila DSM 21120]